MLQIINILNPPQLENHRPSKLSVVLTDECQSETSLCRHFGKHKPRNPSPCSNLSCCTVLFPYSDWHGRNLVNCFVVSVDQYCHVLCVCKCDLGGLLNLMECAEGDKEDREGNIRNGGLDSTQMACAGRCKAVCVKHCKVKYILIYVIIICFCIFIPV